MTTTLEIINAMLAVNGEAPVSSVNSTDPAAIQAKNALTLIDRAVQARGWWFNTEPKLRLLPLDGTGEIVLPQNTLQVDPVSSRLDYVKRGTRLYDRTNSTFDIGAEVVVRIVLRLDIEDLPENAATYLRCKAVKEHYTDDDGDEQKIKRLEDRENEAYAFLQREHLANSNVNNKLSPLGQQLLAATNVGANEQPILFDGD